MAKRLHSSPGSQELFVLDHPQVDHDVMVGAKRHEVVEIVAPPLGPRKNVVDVNGVAESAEHASIAVDALCQRAPVARLLGDASDLPGSPFASTLRRAVLVLSLFKRTRQRLDRLPADCAGDFNAPVAAVQLSSACPPVLISTARGAVDAGADGFLGAAEDATAELAGALNARLPLAAAIVAGHVGSAWLHGRPASACAQVHP